MICQTCGFSDELPSEPPSVSSEYSKERAAQAATNAVSRQDVVHSLLTAIVILVVSH